MPLLPASEALGTINRMDERNGCDIKVVNQDKGGGGGERQFEGRQAGEGAEKEEGAVGRRGRGVVPGRSERVPVWHKWCSRGILIDGVFIFKLLSY